MLLLFFNNDEYQKGDFVCGPNIIDMKYVQAESYIQFRDYKGRGRKTRAVVAPITICNQGLEIPYESKELDEHNPGE